MNEMNPGSRDAIVAGCTCAIIDNHHGAGYHGQAGIFVFTSGCPVHWPVGSKLGPMLSVPPLSEEEHPNA